MYVMDNLARILLPLQESVDYVNTIGVEIMCNILKLVLESNNVTELTLLPLLEG